MSDMSHLVLQTLHKLIDETMEQWASAFDGPPEDQMEALEIMADVRDGIAALLKREEST